ncbi:MAG: glycosyltransferase family 2 protein [Candidatus Gastranaerophilaceae bacterium]
MGNVDVVIPVYKPDKKLQMVISRLMGQTIVPSNIFLIHTRSSEDDWHTEQLLQEVQTEYSVVQVVSIAQEEFDHGGTRDMAMHLCKSQYVLMMTQDAMPKNGKLIENLRNAQGEKISVVFARQEPAKDCRIIERYTRTFNYPAESHSAMEKAAQTNNGIKSIFCSDVCAMYDRIAYEEVGGFPGKVIFNEDEIFAAKSLKAGYDIRYEAQAVVIHSHNYSGVQYFKRYFDLGVSQADFSYIFNEYHAEDEGIRLVKQTFRYLMKRKSYFDIPVLFYHSGMKWIGMKLGKMYRKLPDKIIMKCTSNKAYWKR